MTYGEQDILFEKGSYWVLRKRKKDGREYAEIYRVGATHSTRTGIIDYGDMEMTLKAARLQIDRFVRIDEIVAESAHFAQIVRDYANRLILERGSMGWDGLTNDEEIRLGQLATIAQDRARCYFGRQIRLSAETGGRLGGYR
jgi:ribosomal protein L20